VLDLKYDLRRMSSMRSVHLDSQDKGGIGKCGHWDNELDFSGHCRDEDCRHSRVVNALLTGRACMGSDGVLRWLV
jgi:hypothetical protein